MARIAGINIPPNQHAEIGLTAIYGIGRPRARQILESVGVEKTLQTLNWKRFVMQSVSSQLKVTFVVKFSYQLSALST